MPRECSGPAVEARPDLGGRGDGRRRGLSVYERAPPAEGGAGGSGTPSPRDLNPGSVGLHPPEKDGPAGRRVMRTGGGTRGRRGLRAPAQARETSTRRLPPPRRRRGRKPSQPTLRAPQASLDPASHRTEGSSAGPQSAGRSPQHGRPGRFLLRNGGRVQPRRRLCSASGAGPWEPWDPAASGAFGTSQGARKHYLHPTSSRELRRAPVKQSAVSAVCRWQRILQGRSAPQDEERRKTSGCRVDPGRAFAFALDGGSWRTAGNVLPRTIPAQLRGRLV